MMSKVSLVKRPALPAVGTAVEFIPASSDTREWRRGVMELKSATGNAWVMSGVWLSCALPADVRVYR